MQRICYSKGSTAEPSQKWNAPNTKVAVLVDGKSAGSIFYLCQAEKCDVHNLVTRYQPTPQEKALRKKEALAARVEKLSRVRILEAIRKRLPDVLSRSDLEMVALDYFRRLGHDNHRRLSKLYAWKEKKSKTSWGAQTVDYEKITASAVQVMKVADLNRFLVVCALVSDLYCRGYNPRQSLEKNSNLARTEARYKLDAPKIAMTVRAELSKTKNKPTKQIQPANKPTTAKSARHKRSK
jgi:hypothetical protein